MTTDEAFNELLVKLFKDITEIEGRELVTEEFHDITYNDFHIIEGYEHHEAFHNRMISSMKNSLSREELTVLAHSMETLTNFFHEVYEENKKK